MTDIDFGDDNIDFGDEVIDPGEVIRPRRSFDAVQVRAVFRDYHAGVASNGLNYGLQFDVAAGQSDAIAAVFDGGSARLLWHPDGASKPLLLSEAAIPAATFYTMKVVEGEGQRHRISIKLTRSDVERGVGGTLGLIRLPEYEQHGAPGMLTLEPNQMNAGF